MATLPSGIYAVATPGGPFMGVWTGGPTPGHTAQGWLIAYPDGLRTPATSSLNFDPSDYAVANHAIVGLGANGQLCINSGTLNSAPGSSRALVDALGHLAP